MKSKTIGSDDSAVVVGIDAVRFPAPTIFLVDGGIGLCCTPDAVLVAPMTSTDHLPPCWQQVNTVWSDGGVQVCIDKASHIELDETPEFAGFTSGVNDIATPPVDDVNMEVNLAFRSVEIGGDHLLMIFLRDLILRSRVNESMEWKFAGLYRVEEGRLVQCPLPVVADETDEQTH